MPLSRSHATGTPCHVRRLVEFAEPRPGDVCLNVATGDTPLARALGPRVAEVTGTGTGTLPGGPFTLVTACLTPAPAAEPEDLIRRLLGRCSGRLIVADVVRTRTGDCGHIERLRDPRRAPTCSARQLVELVERAGGRTRRLDVFTIERPLRPWLGGGDGHDRAVRELTAELDGGPKTGARPRLIGGELWFAQSWAYIASEPAGPAGPFGGSAAGGPARDSLIGPAWVSGSRRAAAPPHR